jgi:dTDP-glucose 4,6-dehydratase
MAILITGGAGFIGSALIRYLINGTENTIINFDKRTYAGNLDSLLDVSGDTKYHFEQGDICDPERVSPLLKKYQPDVVMNLAAESHVDRSIDGSLEFVRTNVFGTAVLLDCVRG